MGCIPYEQILNYVERVHVDKFNVYCYFTCKDERDRVRHILSTIPFEPYEGKMVFSYKDVLLHPFRSWERYYHTPITIYSPDNQETIVQKAFALIEDKFDCKNGTLILKNVQK
ncbi:hypothetical protein [Sulfurimonas sp. HSL-1716]|uniref:hypothetical protein n=1 Tax=Hydrocurvibacter sulfurireducens TaxID=3131937 RepID=UPI0031FA15B3